jgi:hypothetical protein
MPPLGFRRIQPDLRILSIHHHNLRWILPKEAKKCIFDQKLYKGTTAHIFEDYSRILTLADTNVKMKIVPYLHNE